jgi:Holliday junction resolvase RusA-like endonuclease
MPERRTWSAFIRGLPQPQGSGQAFVNPKTHRAIYSSMTPGVREWRQVVKNYLSMNWDASAPFDGAIAASFIFVFPRVKSAPKRVFHTVSPDEDKLCRAMLDALTKGAAITDDARVFAPTPIGIYGDEPGVHILLRELEETAEALMAFRLEHAQGEFDLVKEARP